MKNTKTNSQGGSALVYSTETGRICPECSQAVAQCICKQKKSAPSGDGVVRVSLDTKGRKGKGVTVIKGALLDEAALVQLGKQVRSACGAGGTTKDGVIEVQGDHCERVMELLKQQGFIVKKAGG
ncbi:MAG TPA: translation initiation factor Sui1 [Rhodocyclaceae bacterium]|jgi:translation initiation factor 1|nr:translation initiation factor Sui1 [Rhodocyclaceae bacterium]